MRRRLQSLRAVAACSRTRPCALAPRRAAAAARAAARRTGAAAAALRQARARAVARAARERAGAARAQSARRVGSRSAPSRLDGVATRLAAVHAAAPARCARALGALAAHAARREPARDARARLRDRARRRRVTSLTDARSDADPGAADRRARLRARRRSARDGDGDRRRRATRQNGADERTSRAPCVDATTVRARRARSCACLVLLLGRRATRAPALAAEPRRCRRRLARARRTRASSPLERRRATIPGAVYFGAAPRAGRARRRRGWIAIVGHSARHGARAADARCWRRPTADDADAKLAFDVGAEDLRRAAASTSSRASRSAAGGPEAHRGRARTHRSGARRLFGGVHADLALAGARAGPAFEFVRAAARLQRPVAQPAQRHGHRRADRHADP